MFLSTGAALVSTAFYLFAPLGILLSRSFQPDALMMLMFLVSLFL
jgi:4-amino-4-deoxy-L-arabinose transferase-like glycosyltransferase